MSGSIPIPHALGTECFYAERFAKQEVATCEGCAGTGLATLRLACGDYQIACPDCATAYSERGDGQTSTSRTSYHARSFTPRRVRVDGEEIWYSEAEPDAGAYSSVEAKLLFSTRKECEARCAQLDQEAELEQLDRRAREILGKRSRAHGTIRAWRKRVKELRDQLALAEERLRKVTP